jgi:hypothetical protein
MQSIEANQKSNDVYAKKSLLTRKDPPEYIKKIREELRKNY